MSDYLTTEAQFKQNILDKTRSKGMQVAEEWRTEINGEWIIEPIEPIPLPHKKIKKSMKHRHWFEKNGEKA